MLHNIITLLITILYLTSLFCADASIKAIFKQMTWLPNEIPKSDFVLFTMIDRVTNHLCNNLVELYFFNLFN